MSTAKNIPGIQRGPEFDREVHEKATVEKVDKAAKLERTPEVNDPIVSAAVDAVSEVADSLGRKVDVQYDPSSGEIVMTIYTADGEKVLRRVPPEEAVRLSQRLQSNRSKFFESVF